jgi:predicted nuclease of predicted toxin-antitoxin system
MMITLLFDQNLSFRLVAALDDLYPGSAHVRDFGLERASDEDVWAYAAKNHFAIVSKDSDFRQRSFLFGHPPKCLWLCIGNCSTAQVEELLRNRCEDVQRFAE